MAGKQPDYVSYASYLLRLWQAEEDGRLVWRASLESTVDGHRLNFAGLDALVAFLETKFAPRSVEDRVEQ
jgi:hypothetical protein